MLQICDDTLRQHLLCQYSLSAEFQYGTEVPVLHINEVSSLKFYRSYVSTNQPVLIHAACQHWKAYRLWTKQYLWCVPTI